MQTKTKQTKNQCDIFGTKLYITKLYRNQEKTKEKQTAKIIKERQHRLYRYDYILLCLYNIDFGIMLLAFRLSLLFCLGNHQNCYFSVQSTKCIK